ncbi:hypothetical protein M0R45_009532 [Rubus argutus]|uniref:Secreted protein n=1 Tax=Rubus argutus TaxID=59490 RepID=A0AAW1Y487_RUBAR
MPSSRARGCACKSVVLCASAALMVALVGVDNGMTGPLKTIMTTIPMMVRIYSSHHLGPAAHLAHPQPLYPAITQRTEE